MAAIGIYMADFAITLWVWNLTGSAAALALTGFFYELPRIVASLSAGILIDRMGCKFLMILSRVVTASATLVVLLLYLSGHLAIWHLYAVAFAKSGFEKCGWIAYEASVALIVEPHNYTRANSMEEATGYSASIIAPATAGVLYPIVGLGGILPINLVALFLAIATLTPLYIPRPAATPDASSDQAIKASNADGKQRTDIITKFGRLWADVTFGLRYVWRGSEGVASPTRRLRTLLVVTLLFWLIYGLSDMVYAPMILSRTDSNSAALGAIDTVWGFGGIIGAIALTIWGGFRQTYKGLLLGGIGIAFAEIAFGLGRGLAVWIPAQFCAALIFPLIRGSESTLWMSATPISLQGRVFAARAVADDILDMGVVLSGGVLGDALEAWFQQQVSTSAMSSSHLWQSLLVYLFGRGAGAGYALFYVGCAIVMLLVGIIGFRLPQLRLIGKTKKAESKL